MKSLITTIILAGVAFSAQAEQKDGQGCMWTTGAGVCAFQLPAESKSTSCKLIAQGTTQSNKSFSKTEEVQMKPSEVALVKVKSDDAIKKLTAQMECKE